MMLIETHFSVQLKPNLKVLSETADFKKFSCVGDKILAILASQHLDWMCSSECMQ